MNGPKQIKFVTQYDSQKNQVGVTITEQTVIGGEFGRDGVSGCDDTPGFNARNGVKLMSVAEPEMKSATQIFLRGYRTIKDSTVLWLTPEDFAAFCQAVFEYNEWGKQAPVAPVKDAWTKLTEVIEEHVSSEYQDDLVSIFDAVRSEAKEPAAIPSLAPAVLEAIRKTDFGDYENAVQDFLLDVAKGETPDEIFRDTDLGCQETAARRVYAFLQSADGAEVLAALKKVVRQ